MIKKRPLLWSLMCAALSACGAPQPPPETTTATADAPLRVDAQMRAALGLESAAVGSAAIRETLTVYGEIVPVPERVRSVAARYPGVARTAYKAIGDTVAAGETLLTVESNDSMEPYRVLSPIAGRVLERRINPGEETSGIPALFVVGDLSRVRAELAVFADDLARVHTGQTVNVRDERDGAVEAHLDYIAPATREGSRSVSAYAMLDNASGRWTPGQFISADIVVAEREVARAVPLSALQDIDGTPHVFVETADGYAPRAVRLGDRDRDHAEVIEGLAAGEHVVVANSFVLKSEWLTREVE